MNKLFTFALLANLLLAANALAGMLSDTELDEETCPKFILIQGENALECRGADNFRLIKKAAVGRSIKETPIALDWHGAIELGVLPDADTDMIYGYLRELLDPAGKIIGYLSIDGFVNREMGSKVQTTTRYNLEGRLVTAKAK